MVTNPKSARTADNFWKLKFSFWRAFSELYIGNSSQVNRHSGPHGFQSDNELRSMRLAIRQTYIYRSRVELFRFAVPRVGVADFGINAALEATSDE